jgi:hypothetical protein
MKHNALLPLHTPMLPIAKESVEILLYSLTMQQSMKVVEVSIFATEYDDCFLNRQTEWMEKTRQPSLCLIKFGVFLKSAPTVSLLP